MIMVSIICPTYNQGKYLQQGLESILMQRVTFPFEILIGEDCSPDNTNEILLEYEEKYPELIQVFHRKKNLKQSKNIYDLFMRAKGKYVITLDLDDYWTDENKLAKQVEFLENHREYIGVAHDYYVVDATGQRHEEQIKGIEEDFLNSEFTLKDFENTGHVYQTGTFLYRNIWKEDKDYQVLYEADDTVVDVTINFMLLLRSNVFIMEEKMSAYRLIISLDDNATNARSVGQKNLALDFYKSCHQMEVLNRYFKGQVDLSKMWSNYILSYFKNMIKTEDERFQRKQFFVMLGKANIRTKKKVLGYLAGSLLRKMRKDEG